jgi:DNA-binding NarL/FixJ family response regulator
MSIRLLFADDHLIVRTGLKSLLRDTDIKIAGEAANSEGAVRLARRLNPDVVLLDVRMPDNDGLYTLSKIKSGQPDLPVLMWSAFDDPALIARAVALGAQGYILKAATRDELVKAIRIAAFGGTTWMNAELRRVARTLAPPAATAEMEMALTPRETDVLKVLLQGAMNHEIARTLGIGRETVKVHVKNIFRKLRVTDRTQAALWAVRNDLG